jgi:hypothetical protein
MTVNSPNGHDFTVLNGSRRSTAKLSCVSRLQIIHGWSQLFLTVRPRAEGFTSPSQNRYSEVRLTVQGNE